MVSNVCHCGCCIKSVTVLSLWNNPLMPSMLEMRDLLFLQPQGRHCAWKPGRESPTVYLSLPLSSVTIWKLTLRTSDNVGSLQRGQTPTLIRLLLGRSVEEFRLQSAAALPAIEGPAARYTDFSCSLNHHSNFPFCSEKLQWNFKFYIYIQILSSPYTCCYLHTLFKHHLNAQYVFH